MRLRRSSRTQHGARLALVELQPGDEAEWRRRVEARGEQERGTEHEHKPGSWEAVQTVAARNNGSEAWSNSVEVPLRCCLDSTAASAGEQLGAVLRMLAAGGVDAAAAVVAQQHAAAEEVEQNLAAATAAGAAQR